MTADIKTIATQARAFLEPVWLVWQHQEARPLTDLPSRQTSGRSSLFLRDALRLAGQPAEWINGIPRVTEQGPVIGDFGFCAGGRWESHAWVTCPGWIVDVTADQFGAAPVIVTADPDPRYNPRAGEITSAAAIAVPQRAVARIWPAWLALQAGNLAVGQQKPDGFG